MWISAPELGGRAGREGLPSGSSVLEIPGSGDFGFPARLQEHPAPGSYPTAGSPSRSTKSNRHSFHMALTSAPRAGPPAGGELPALCPPACRPTPRPTLPAGKYHHAAHSEHSCLAKASGRCEARAPAALGNSILDPSDPQQLRAAVLIEPKEG